MKKIFGMRKHRDKNRELDERYEEEILDYDEDYPEDEDDYPEDDEDYRRGKGRYRDEDEDYPEDDEDYRDEDDDYPENDEDYREVDEDDYPENDEDYREVDEDYRDDDDYPEDDEDYREVDEDNRDDEEDYLERDEEDAQGKEYASDAGEFYEEDEYPEDEEIYGKESHVDDVERGTIVSFAAHVEKDEAFSEEYEDYREDDAYREVEDDYPEDEEDYPEDDEDYPEDEDDYPEDEDDYPEDEDDYPEDDDDYPEDDRNYRDDRRDRDGVGARILSFIANTSAVERIAVGFALLIVIGGIVTASFYSSAKKGNQQIESFTEIGTGLQGIDVIGQSGLIAIADAEKARAMAADLITENYEEEEEEIIVADDAEDVTIQMTVTSIKSDLKVKFINSKTGKLVANLPLEIDVVNPDGTTVTYNDHDQDGIIYKKDLTAGEYKVTPKALGAGFENYKLELSSKSVTVKDTVEMKAVDVSNEIKKESQVNAAKEDTAVKTEVESVLQDTVEWVESTKTAVGESDDGNYTYEKIDRNDIPDPASSAMIGFAKFMLLSTTDASVISDTSSENTTTEEESKKEEGSSDNSSEAGGNTDNNENNGDNKQDENKENNKENEQEKPKGTIKLGTTSFEITVGDSRKIDVSEPSSVSFSTDQTDIIKLSNDGSVTGLKEGSATVTVSADNCDSVTVSVKVNAAKKNITILTSSLNIVAGKTEKISVSDLSACSFRSENEKVATVSSDGTVTGVAEGTTKIVVSADSNEVGKVDVTVTKAEAGKIVVNTKSVTLKVKDTVKLDITSPNPKDVSYKSKDETVATVKDGVITAVSLGTTEIIISANGYDDEKVEVKVEARNEEAPINYSKITLVEGRTFDVYASSDKNLAIRLTTDNADVAAVSNNTITAKSKGQATVTVSSDKYADKKIEVTVVSRGTVLKDKEGRTVYVKNDDGSFVEATYEDYYSGRELFLRKGVTSYRYTGWQTIGGKTYFFDKNGNYVTGEHVIQGAKYKFGADGVLTTTAGAMGIDVSKWNGNIDWAAVKNSGVQFVIIRCGYRGSSEGALIEDPKFKSNISGALNAGLRVGVYFFTQAINEVEAVEEASMVINLVRGYNISFPIYLDVEGSNGRGDAISPAQRTANIRAFCGTIANAGYSAGVYANKTWFTSKINTSQITNFKIWLAQYAQAVTYTGSRYDMWQYSSKGRVTGISGNVDMNICY